MAFDPQALLRNPDRDLREFAMRDEVHIVGLVARRDLNGKCGRIVLVADGEVPVRYAVKVEGTEDVEPEVVKVKAVNLKKRNALPLSLWVRVVSENFSRTETIAFAMTCRKFSVVSSVAKPKVLAQHSYGSKVNQERVALSHSPPHPTLWSSGVRVDPSSLVRSDSDSVFPSYFLVVSVS